MFQNMIFCLMCNLRNIQSLEPETNELLIYFSSFFSKHGLGCIYCKKSILGNSGKPFILDQFINHGIFFVPLHHEYPKPLQFIIIANRDIFLSQILTLQIHLDTFMSRKCNFYLISS